MSSFFSHCAVQHTAPVATEEDVYRIGPRNDAFPSTNLTKTPKLPRLDPHVNKCPSCPGPVGRPVSTGDSRFDEDSRGRFRRDHSLSYLSVYWTYGSTTDGRFISRVLVHEKYIRSFHVRLINNL